MTRLQKHWPVLLFLPLAWIVAFTHDAKNSLGLGDFAHFFEKTGNNTALVVALGTLLWLAYRARDRAQALRVVGTMLTETALYGLLKFGTWKGLHILPRPSGGDGGFPSGHTAAHCALAFLLTERFPKLAPLWYLWAGLMAWSRVEAGAHFAYQIVSGTVLGLAVALAFHRVTSDASAGASSGNENE